MHLRKVEEHCRA